MSRWLALLLFSTLLVIGASDASAKWDRVRAYVQPEVEVTELEEDRLVLWHPEIKQTLVLTLEPTKSSHIYSKIRRQRGGNPYRVWMASELLWNHPELPRSSWGAFFRVEFLRIVRPHRPQVAK